MKLDILAIGAHPDDIELGCSGTIAKEIANGKKVGVLDLTRGELGTRGTAETRDQEAAEASEILGLSVRENLGFADGFFVNDKEHQMEIIKIIRKYQPDVVLMNAIRDRHIDHGRGSELASNSCFLSGLVKIETRAAGEIQKPWRPKQVYHYIQWQNIEPDVLVDVSEYMETKIKSIMAYKTQFFDPESKEPETPISSKQFIKGIEFRAMDMGKFANVKFAEGFTSERYVAVDKISDLI